MTHELMPEHLEALRQAVLDDIRPLVQALVSEALRDQIDISCVTVQAVDEEALARKVSQRIVQQMRAGVAMRPDIMQRAQAARRLKADGGSSS